MKNKITIHPLFFKYKDNFDLLFPYRDFYHSILNGTDNFACNCWIQAVSNAIRDDSNPTTSRLWIAAQIKADKGIKQQGVCSLLLFDKNEQPLLITF